MQDVDSFLLAKGIELNGYLDPSRPAILDDEHQVRVNYEAFFFADVANRNRFLVEPVRFCGLVTDPVTKRRFLPSPASRRTGHEGVIYFFESGHSAGMFQRAPEQYVLPGWEM